MFNIICRINRVKESILSMRKLVKKSLQNFRNIDNVLRLVDATGLNRFVNEAYFTSQ